MYKYIVLHSFPKFNYRSSSGLEIFSINDKWLKKAYKLLHSMTISSSYNLEIVLLLLPANQTIVFVKDASLYFTNCGTSAEGAIL